MLSHFVSEFVGDDPVVWSFTMCPDNAATEDHMMYRAEFGVMLLAEGPRTVFIQKSLDVSAFPITILTRALLSACRRAPIRAAWCAFSSRESTWGGFDGHARPFGYGAPPGK